MEYTAKYCSFSKYTINTFKARLDRFLLDQEVKYNWKSDIKTGSRSQISVIVDYSSYDYDIWIWTSRSLDLRSDNSITTTTTTTKYSNKSR